MEIPNQLWRFRLVSCVIVVVLGLQLFAVIARTARGWPFTDYPMYATSHEEGDRVPVGSKLYATFADGSETLVTPNDLGIGDNWWMYHFWILGALEAAPQPGSTGDSWRSTFVDRDQPPSWMIGERKSPERALAFVLERYDRLRGKKVVKLRLEDQGVIVTRQGMKPVPSQVLWTWSVPSGEGAKG